MTKRPFIMKGHGTKECLELVHNDVCGPFIIHTWEGYEYIITFIDEYSRLGYVYLVHREYDVLDKFIEFKVELDNLLGKHINALQLD